MMNELMTTMIWNAWLALQAAKLQNKKDILWK